MNFAIKNIDGKLLYKLFVQLLIFSQGINRNLDTHIINIRQQLKKSDNPDVLNQNLQHMSATIEHLLKLQASKDTPPSLSIKFSIQKEKYIVRLNEILQSITTPDKYLGQSQYIQQKLKEDLDDNAFESVIHSALTLILNINSFVQDEQQETERFLEDISSQLNQLGQLTNVASQSSEATLADRENINHAIYSQIDNIKHSASNALELSVLQKNITLHVQDLTEQLKKQKLTEDHYLRDTQKQLNDMSLKLKELESEAQHLRNNLKQAHAQAYEDPLTGLPNRLAYNEKVSSEYKYFKRYKKPLSLLVWDIDNFKQINDQFGHKTGDKTLTLVGQLLHKNCRETDFIARYGGEEFVMLLPNVNAAQAFIAAEKMRKIIEQSGFNYHGKKINLTISCGICEFVEDKNQEDIFESADQALYRSKKNGRNLCTVFDATSPD